MADEFKTTLASTVSELVDNALEHAVSDCLIDIDVTEHDHMLMNDNNLYYGVNVVDLASVSHREWEIQRVEVQKRV